jgi:UDP-glucose 4-epimerase
MTPPIKKRILVTGGCGYIGSHTLISLLDPSSSIHKNIEYSVVVVDNLANSSAESLIRVADISNLQNFTLSSDGTSGQDEEGRLIFRKVNCCDKDALRGVFTEFHGGFEAAVHFAGLKAVGESKLLPLSYYSENIGSTLTLLSLMEEFGVRSIVFSSSATVYGVAKDETAKLKEVDEVGVTITNCYGRTKYMIEQILGDFHASHKFLRDTGGESSKDIKDWSVTILRYFNPVGAHPSGKMGEDPHGVPNNLMPFVAQVAVGRRPHVSVFGNDYNTPDGTGVRDYLHVMDLADGHVAALGYMDDDVATAKNGSGQLSVFNLGTGTGYSVLDMVRAMSKACGKEIPYVLAPRRPGDVTIYMADPTKAKEDMGWEAKRNLDDMCNDLWNWQTNNPNGYGSGE